MRPMNHDGLSGGRRGLWGEGVDLIMGSKSFRGMVKQVLNLKLRSFMTLRL